MGAHLRKRDLVVIAAVAVNAHCNEGVLLLVRAALQFPTDGLTEKVVRHCTACISDNDCMSRQQPFAKKLV